MTTPNQNLSLIWQPTMPHVDLTRLLRGLIEECGITDLPSDADQIWQQESNRCLANLLHDHHPETSWAANQERFQAVYTHWQEITPASMKSEWKHLANLWQVSALRVDHPDIPELPALTGDDLTILATLIPQILTWEQAGKPQDTKPTWPTPDASPTTAAPEIYRLLAETDGRPSLLAGSLAAPEAAGELVAHLNQRIDEALRGRPELADPQRLLGPHGIEEPAARYLDFAQHMTMQLEFTEGPEATSRAHVALLAGLGSDFVRSYAGKRLRADGGYWSQIEQMDEATLRQEVSQAQQATGFGAGLLLLPGDETLALLAQVDANPTWAIQIAFSHVVRHTRVYTNAESKLVLRVAYRHTWYDLTVPNGAEWAPLSNSHNLANYREILKTVGLGKVADRVGRKPKQKEFEEPAPGDRMWWAIADALSSLTAATFPVLRENPIHWLIPEEVGLEQDVDAPASWIDVRLAATGARRIDLDTGRVSRQPLRGHELLVLQLPFTKPGALANRTARQSLDWLPGQIEPALPGDFLVCSAFRNLHREFQGTDHTDEMVRLINCLVVANFVREQAGQSAIGRTLQNEFPGFFIGSAGVGEQPSSGQGKTTLARLLAQMLVPKAGLIQVGRSSGVVSQRAAAKQLMDTGLLAADEFKVVERQGSDHWANRDGLQSLMTGGSVSVGEAGKNNAATRLRFGPIFSGKYFHFPVDCVKRLVPLLLTQFDGDTATAAEVQQQLASDRLAPLLRLQAMLWIAKNNLIETIADLPVGTTDGRFRFPGHLGIYHALYGQAPGETFFGTIDAMREHALAICQEAKRTGALQANDQGDSFSIWEFLESMPSAEFETLESVVKLRRMNPKDFLVYLVRRVGELTDQPTRSLREVLLEHRLPQKKAVHIVTEELRQGLEIEGRKFKLTEGYHPIRRRSMTLVNITSVPLVGGTEPKTPTTSNRQGEGEAAA